MAKVLLVEDDNNLREIYQARLQAEGYTIVSARDGEEGLVVAKAEKPDLIVADVMMPKISGFEMLDIIRNTDTLKAVKVIMLTALGQSDDQKRADKLGADRYLVKSQVTLEDIVKAAHELLGEDNAPAPAGTSEPTAPTDTTAPAPAEPAAEAPSATPTIEVKSAPAEPAPAPAESTPAPEASAEAADDATTAKQEATEAEAKIEDFVAGATSEPTAPTEAAVPAATPAPATDDQASDDKVMSDAVDNLNASIDPKDKDDSAAGAPAIEPEKKTPSSAGGSKKVIQPIDTGDTKKDIHTLLAEEEAKEAASAAGTVNPPTPQTPPADDQAKPADPNSISL